MIQKIQKTQKIQNLLLKTRGGFGLYNFALICAIMASHILIPKIFTKQGNIPSKNNKR